MEGKSQPRLLFVAAALLAVIAIVFIVVVPGATRVSMVVNYGVKTADQIRTALYIVGAILAVASVYLGFRGYQATLKKKHKKPRTLLRRDETDLELIVPELKRIAMQYPTTADEIDQTLADQESLRKSLTTIDKIFKVNPGAIVEGDTEFNFASFQFLLQRVIDGTCSDLVGIIYQAEATQDSSIDRLERFIDQVNQTNIARIEMAQELAFKAAESVPKVGQASSDNTYAPKYLGQLLKQLSETETVLQEGIS